MARFLCLALLAIAASSRAQNEVACGDDIIGDTTGGPSSSFNGNPSDILRIAIPPGTNGLFLSTCHEFGFSTGEPASVSTLQFENEGYQAVLQLYADVNLTNLQCESDRPVSRDCYAYTGELQVFVGDLDPPADGTYYYLAVSLGYPTEGNYSLTVECTEEMSCLAEPTIPNSPWENGTCNTFFNGESLLEGRGPGAAKGGRRNAKSLSKSARQAYIRAKKGGAHLPFPELQSTESPNSYCCAPSLHGVECHNFYCPFPYVQVGDDPLCRDGTWVTPECVTGAQCLTEPVIVNGNPTTCGPTESGSYCSTPVTCQAGFTQWGGQPLCYDGNWIGVPRCVTPGSGYGHLWFMSLDRAGFAYHKPRTIRMWESPSNDMELQIRTLSPSGINCTATLIGMVALRAADQTISVVGSEGTMDIYFNDVLQTGLVEGDAILLGSGADLLSVTYTNATNPTLQVSSKRGALFNIIWYYFPAMSWLAVPHTLDPATFYGDTMGLLGVYDGDASNDFTLRNGTVLPGAVLTADTNGVQTEFGDSWVVDPIESLFSSAQDTIASNNAEYQIGVSPPYVECPVDFSGESVAECDSLAPELVTPCKFDVIIGGPQFLDDIVYQPACGTNDDQFCSYHGTCIDDLYCDCNPGWFGADCEYRDCPIDCLDAPGGGSCDEVTGLCECAEGFTGPTCEEVADCSALDDCNALAGQGVCIDHGICECEPGFVQPNCAESPDCPTEVDDNLEVQYPPELDESQTEVIFDGNGQAHFLVTIVVPKQYNTARFSFDNALSIAGGFDSEGSFTNTYWSPDAVSDPCNTIYTGLIPWDDFRRELGGVDTDVGASSTIMSATIDIRVTRPITVTPETKLLQVADIGFTRTVSLKVPFQIVFQTRLTLHNNITIPADHLRVTPVLIETSIVEIVDDDNVDHVAIARFEIVTTIPLPLALDPYPSINVPNPLLNNGIQIVQGPARAADDCLPDNAFCTQYWLVTVYPEQCHGLDGNYTVRWTGSCFDTRNCVEPSPNYSEFVFHITSDSFCADVQTITLDGTLYLHPNVECNERLTGTVTVYNDNNNAAINKTTIAEVLAWPPLANPFNPDNSSRFIEVYSEGQVAPAFPLDYQIDSETPNQVTFSFLWSGADLRCDVNAEVSVVVYVEYQATRNLSLLEMPAGSNKKSVKAGETFTTTMLMELDDQTMQFAGRTSVGAGSDSGNLGPQDTVIAGVSNTILIAAAAGIGALLIAILVVGFLIVRKVKQEARKQDGDAANEPPPVVLNAITE